MDNINAWMPLPSPIVAPDTIAQLALSTFAALPRSFKPTIRTNGVPEWTILASIILSIPSLGVTEGSPNLRLVSLGTGVKCLPTNKLPPCGDSLHDSHAEVMAKRGFGRFLLDEALASTGAEPSRQSQILEQIQRDGKSKFRLRRGISVHLYVSALPCGNASTLYTAAHQPKSMADLKDSHASTSPTLNPESSTSRGRNGYSNTSSLRTKPGRPDSFPSISMSCSDKIASWHVLGLQGGLLAKWFDPIYLDSVIIGGVGQAPTDEDVVGFARAAGSNADVSLGWEGAIRAEVEEALYGRLGSIESRLPSPYRLARPSIHFTSLPFTFDKPSISALYPQSEPSPHPTSVLHYSKPIATGGYASEHLFNGVDRRAAWKSPGLIPIDEKRRSGACKLEMMRASLRLEAMMRDGEGTTQVGGKLRYHDLKKGTTYQDVKALLRGTPGELGMVKGFEKCGELSVTERRVELSGAGVHAGLSVPDPPFAGWIVSGEKWESFDSEGGL